MNLFTASTDPFARQRTQWLNHGCPTDGPFGIRYPEDAENERLGRCRNLVTQTRERDGWRYVTNKERGRVTEHYRVIPGKPVTREELPIPEDPREVARRPDPRTNQYAVDAEGRSIPIDPVTHQPLPPLQPSPEATDTLEVTTSAAPAPVQEAEQTPAVAEPKSQADRLMTALLAAQRSIHGVGKTSHNDFSDYDYASAEDIIAAARQALHDAGLLARRGSWKIQPAGDGLMVEMAFELAHPASGQRVAESVTFPAIPGKGRPADKAVAAALTSAWSYWLRDLLLIPRCDSEMDNRDDRPHVPQRQDTAQERPQPSTRSTEHDHDESFQGRLTRLMMQRGVDRPTAQVAFARWLRDLHRQPTQDDIETFTAAIERGEHDPAAAA